MDTNLQTRIEKLLALAGNNPSAEEAEAAMLKAQTLLARHDMTIEDLPGEAPAEVDEVSLTEPGRRATWWKSSLATTIAGNFRCFVYLRWTSHSGASRCLTLVGRPADSAVARHVYLLAVRTADREARRHLAARKRASHHWSRRFSRGLRNDFLRGYVEGIREAFRRNVEQTGSQLMVVRPAEVDAHVLALNLKRTPGSSTTTAGCAEARLSGWRRGQDFSYHDPLDS